LQIFDNFQPLYSLSGLVVGMLVGITGVGGGSLMTPLLVLVFGIHPATAVGTDLLYAAITKTAGTAIHGFNKTIDWKIVGRLALGSVPAAVLTLLALSGVDRHSLGFAKTLTVALGYMLIVTAVLLLLRRQITAYYTARRVGKPSLSPALAASATVVLGVALGALVTLTSVGAGALGVTVLLALYPKLEIKDIVGSDIVHAVPLTLIAGMGYWWIGEVDWSMLASLLVGSVPGIIIGSMLAPRMPDKVIRPILACTLGLVGIKLIFG